MTPAELALYLALLGVGPAAPPAQPAPPPVLVPCQGCLVPTPDGPVGPAVVAAGTEWHAGRGLGPEPGLPTTPAHPPAGALPAVSAAGRIGRVVGLDSSASSR